jgi:hypothetical protein
MKMRDAWDQLDRKKSEEMIASHPYAVIFNVDGCAVLMRETRSYGGEPVQFASGDEATAAARKHGLGRFPFDVVSVREIGSRRVLAEDQQGCKTCKGLKIVSTKWPSGYPHATPCPECQPGVPCGCGLPRGDCPSAEAIASWRKERDV